MSLGKWDLVGVMNARKALAATKQVRNFVILFFINAQSNSEMNWMLTRPYTTVLKFGKPE